MSAGTRKLLVDIRAIAPAWRVTDDALKMLATEDAPGWKVHLASSETNSDGDGGARPSDEVMTEIADAEAYFGFGISRDVFRAGKALKWVHSGSAGVGGVLFEEMLRSDVKLTNSAGVYGNTIAEHVLCGVLYFLRAFDYSVAAQHQRKWLKVELTGAGSPMRELAGSRVVIVGTGGIGGAVANMFSALGAECIGIRRRMEKGVPAGFTKVAGIDGLDAELGNADVLVLASAATSETRGLLSRSRLALLPREAIVVNVARGTLVEEAALCEALDEGRLRGAFLDVVGSEPLGAESPLWTQRGLLITPHVAGVSPTGYWRREMTLFLDNWRRYRNDEPLRNLVDKQAGY